MHKRLQVIRCANSAIHKHLPEVDVAVPLMCKLDAKLLRSAERLKLIIQYGVVVEGIDIPTVNEYTYSQHSIDITADSEGVRLTVTLNNLSLTKPVTVCLSAYVGHRARHLGE